MTAGTAPEKNAANVLVVCGPTASGKSGLALQLAQQLGGCVINADSMQVYDGLPMLTAQPSAADRAAAPHRLYGALHPADACTAERWRDLAAQEIRRAHAEGLLPIVTGGTGFYLRALMQGFSPVPEVDPTIRARLNDEIRATGNAAFHARLQSCDPEIAAQLHPGNTQRLVRAMEVFEGTGRKLSDWQSAPLQGAPEGLRFITIALLPPREKLYAQCDARFSRMVADGVLEEVGDFMKKDHGVSPLDKALGYPALCRHLQGEIPLADAVQEAQAATRHYAKRQTTWFRNQITPDIVLEKPDADSSLRARIDGLIAD